MISRNPNSGRCGHRMSLICSGGSPQDASANRFVSFDQPSQTIWAVSAEGHNRRQQ